MPRLIRLEHDSYQPRGALVWISGSCVKPGRVFDTKALIDTFAKLIRLPCFGLIECV